MELQYLPIKVSFIYERSLSPDGKLALSGSGYGDWTAKLWDVATGNILHTLGYHPHETYESHTSMCIGHNGSISSAIFSPDGKLALTGSVDRTIIIWDVVSGQKLKSLGHHPHDVLQDEHFPSCRGHLSAINDLSFSPDGKSILTIDTEHGIKLWDSNTGKELNNYKKPVSVYANTNIGGQISPDGKHIMTAQFDGSFYVFDILSGKQSLSFKGKSSLISNIDLSADDSKILSSERSNLRLWDLSTGKATFYNKENEISYIIESAFRPNGDLALFVSGEQAKLANLLNLKTGKLEHQIEHKTLITSLLFSPDGRNAFSANDTDASLLKSSKIWDVSSGQVLFENDKIGDGSGYSKDGVFLHADFGRWNLKTGEIDQSYPIDGEYALTKGSDSTVKIWKSGERGSRTCINTLQGHTAPVLSIALSPDEKYGLSGSRDKTVRLWDIELGKEAWNMSSHKDDVFKVNFSNDGRQALSASLDRSIKLWEVKTGKELVSFMSFENSDDWIITTPDHYFFATKNASRSIHYVIGMKSYSFDQFDLQYNRPDIVLDRIGRASSELINSYRSAYIKRLTKMGFDQDKINRFVNGEFDKSLSAPELYLDEDLRFILETNQKKYSFSFKAYDPKGTALDRLHLSVNGVPVYGVKGKSLNYTSKDTLRYTVKELPLSNGKNSINVSVLNDNGVASLARQFTVNYTGPESKPNLHIVTIGVSKYQDTEMNLDYAAKDAEDLAEALQSNSEKYGDVYVHSFLNERAIKENILRVKEKLMASNVDDEVVLFAAGHGLLDENLDYFIATHDINFISPPERGLPYDKLENLLDGIPARKKLMLLDACHSGEVDKEETALVATNNIQTGEVKFRGFKSKIPKSIGLSNSFELMKELFNDLRSGTGAVVISAASGVEFSYESEEWSNGVFTYSLLEGLKSGKADKDENGQIQVSELKVYITERVVELTDGKQHPTSRRENLEFDFVIW